MHLASCLVAIFVVACGSPVTPKTELVLQAFPTAKQFGEAGWFLSGGGRDDYLVERDGDGWRLSPHASTYGKYGTFMRNVDATPYRGKRVRITIEARSEGTTQRADVWSRVQAATSPTDGSGLVGGWKHLAERADWAPYELVYDVPNEGAWIQYGVGIAGPGVMWMRSAKIEIVGQEIAITAQPTNDRTTEQDAWQGEKTIAGWTMTGVGAPDYDLVSDGDAVRISNSNDSPRYVAVVHTIAASDLVGKKVHASFEAKLDKIAHASCVVKVQRDAKLAYFGFLASELKAIENAKDFVPCDLDVQIPEGARYVLYGVTYKGAGTAWVRGGKLEPR